MIRRIHVQNYRSIKDLTIELHPFNCFVGANNSGKSNIFDVFSFLFDTFQNGLQWAVENRGWDRLRYYGSAASDPILIELTLDSTVGGSGSELEYILHFHVDSSHATQVNKETLTSRDEDGKTKTMFTLQPRSDTPMVDVKVLRDGQMQTFYVLPSPANDSILKGITRSWPQGEALEPMWVFKQYILGLRTYRFKPDRLKSAGPATRTPNLQRDGSNFASYLHDIQSRERRYFDRIQEQLIKNFPEVEELITPFSEKDPGSTEVGIRERWFEEKAQGAQLSEGLVGFVAHLAILYGPDKPTLVSFEEPENYINPKLLERLVEMLKEASKEVQILISTHSVPLMDYLDLEDIIVVERPEGGTKARRAFDQEDLREALKGWALGEAYASGALDGST